MHENKPMNTVQVAVADPSAIGLFGLAMVTLVASSQKLGLTHDYSFVLPWAIFLGGFAQLYASFADSKLGNTFGSTAFGAYGFFWLGIGMSWLAKMGAMGAAFSPQSIDGHQLGFAFVGYLIFTLFMTVGAATTNKVLFSIFVLINFLFIGLAVDSFFPTLTFFHSLAAYSELAISFLSFYASAAAVLNAQFGRVVLPIGKPIIRKS